MIQIEDVTKTFTFRTNTLLRPKTVYPWFFLKHHHRLVPGTQNLKLLTIYLRPWLDGTVGSIDQRDNDIGQRQYQDTFHVCTNIFSFAFFIFFWISCLAQKQKREKHKRSNKIKIKQIKNQNPLELPSCIVLSSYARIAPSTDHPIVLFSIVLSSSLVIPFQIFFPLLFLIFWIPCLSLLKKRSKTKTGTQEKQQNENRANQKSKPTRAPIVHIPIVLSSYLLIVPFSRFRSFFHRLSSHHSKYFFPLLFFNFFNSLLFTQKRSKTKTEKTQKKQQNKNRANQKSKTPRDTVFHHPIVPLSYPHIVSSTHWPIVLFSIVPGPWIAVTSLRVLFYPTLKLQKFVEIKQNCSKSFNVHVKSIARGIFPISIQISFVVLSACMWYFIGDVTRIDEELHPDSWIKRAFSETGNSDLIYEEPSRKYLVSMYWSITTLTTVGFGNLI